MKRIISALIMLPLVILVFVFGNKYVVDIAISLIVLRCMYELYHAFSNKGFNPIRPIGYIAAIAICFLHVIPLNEYFLLGITSVFILSLVISFLCSIITNNKYNAADIGITYFGIFYIVLFSLFISLIRDMDNGKIMIWFLFIPSWVTDIFAYLVGSKIGKHHFTDISPNKTIEGCIGGTLGTIVFIILYAFILNTYFGFNINYVYIGIIGIILSVIAQIGDLAASSIKRYTDMKDFSNLIPGHGMIDRIDSVIFIAPFAYILLLFFV